ncbi:radical SAM protein [candidate division WOR-3 bacterium]|nr:radical SAM protein [candidate division WOR-3 bacterium]
MEPKFLTLSDKKFKEKIGDGYRLLLDCTLCPRGCKINRIKGEIGFCKSDWRLKIASYNLHFGEEPPLSGFSGSGTIFFSNCNLQCKYCQNYSISQLGVGEYYTVDQLAGMMMKLQKRDAHNINFVTPNHFVPQIIKALYKAKKSGLKIPIVYNSSGYDNTKSLNLLSGIVDIYLVDMRYSNPVYSERYSGAKDYVKVNRAALIEMHRQVGDLILEDGIGKRGIIVRHLVMPDDVSGTEDIFRFLSKEISKKTYISLMDQYFPCFKVLKDPVLSRRITIEEYKKAKSLMEKYVLEMGWVQNHDRTL